MKKRILSILLLCCMVLTLLPTAAFAEGSTEESPVCTCETVCTAETMNTECSVCGADGALPESCAKANTGAIAEGAPAQALTSVDITFPTPEAGKPVGDGSAVSANADSGLTLYLFGPALWKQGEEPDKLDENAAYAEGNTYLLNFTFYTQKPITDETVLTYNGKPITRYADYQALTEALDAYDGKQDAYLGCVLFSAEGTGDPAMEDLKDLYLLSLYAFVRVPEAQIPEDTVDEQFTLTPGGTYYFDLSGENIPGTANGSLPDASLHYVPFTYAGTVDAYKLTSAMATTEEYAQQNKYAHSLFVADYVVTNDVSWDTLNTANLIFGKDYAVGGVDYTLRAPSAGSQSNNNRKDDSSTRGIPKSNEWDAILDKANQDWKDNTSGYIKNWSGKYSFGQDNYANASRRAIRGCYSARSWGNLNATGSNPRVGFRPVLEILNADTLGSDGLKVVTLDLGGGTLGGSSDAIQIIVKTGSEFTAPASGGLTRPDGDTDSYFKWLGSDGKLYVPGGSVPANVNKLTAQFDYTEQFTLDPGGTYYFDLSGENIPGTANGSLPDASLHYVPFTYAGTVNAYKLTTEMATTEEYAQREKYPHSLFVADYVVTRTISWGDLNGAGLIFGKDYVAGGVDYTLRAPSCGSGFTGSDDSERGTPQSNEWDAVLDKNSGYVKNWNDIYSWGQDTSSYESGYRAGRGHRSARYWYRNDATFSFPFIGFRPVLEVLNSDTLGSGGLKVVTLDLGGGKLGGSSEDIQIIVKTGSTFTAPASDGMTRPNGDTGSYFMWLGSDGKLYAPSANVPADVTKLTAQFALSEQFSLAPGGRYYFDLSAMNIPGTANGDLPDSTLHYVPFTYAGTVNAYKLTSEMATTEEYAQQYKYDHSLFIADYNVTFNVDWNQLNEKQMIFGTPYTSYGVNYTMRAPSAGSQSNNGKDDSSTRGIPKSNEWDAILDKANQDWKDNTSGYIKNWSGKYSFGQDNYANASRRAFRGYYSARFWTSSTATFSSPIVGFRPVLEILNADTLGPDGLKVVTLDLNGGKLGNSSEDIQIIVKTGSEFTAPASDGLNRPDGDTGSYFMWLGSNGKLYAPGASVPADVTKLTAQFALSEQFSLKPGDTYYFDLSGEDIPGTANSGNSDGAVSLPDTSLHYVPFTYAGTVNAYKLTSAMATTEEYAQQNKYAHSLFIADYNVTHTVSWDDLNTKSLIFGKNYASGGVDYTLRAPSVGSARTGSSEPYRGTPQSNEWDRMLDKDEGHIKNWSNMYSWGQDASNSQSGTVAVCGNSSARYRNVITATNSYSILGFRPVLEVLNPDTLSSDGMKVVTLDLGSGTLGGSSDAIQIIVKKGIAFTAPASGGLNRPDGDTGSYFMWLDGNGNSYEPGDNVPADVTELTVQWTAPTYAVTLHTNGGTIADGKDVTGYTYGVGATLPTDVTRTGYTFKGWYDNEGLTGDPVTAIGNTETGNKEYWAKWEINQYTITYDLAGGTAEGNPDTYTIETRTFTLKNPTKSGYTFTGWSGTGLDGENNMTVTIPTGSTGNRTYTAHWRYNGGGGSGYSYYTIKATAGAGGSISPSGNVSVREGRDQTFTITPDKGYAVANVKIDGKSIGAVKSYTFENVRRTHTIEVIFMKANGNPQTGVFVDVATGSYYEDAVDWAVENGITKGTDDTHFSPDGICTRAQAVTFLWRTAGSPASKTSAMPFTDVPVGSYYYDAVLWAVENGITMGTSDTTFSPDATCSRAQIVTFLWRSEKSPAAGTANPFADVKSTAYYAGAVLWAVKEDITKGTTNTTFSPNADCTRAQIVTFLWRCKK